MISIYIGGPIPNTFDKIPPTMCTFFAQSEVPEQTAVSTNEALPTQQFEADHPLAVR